ncbi:MAG: ABC transporter permease, partial [Bacteroidota bacterium]
MLNNYFKVSLRNIWKNKVASLISILSLVLSLSFSMTLIFYAQNNRNFDNYIPQKESKYRLTFDVFGSKGRNIHSSSSPAPYGPYFTQNTPEIEQYVRFNRERNTLLINKGKSSLKSDYVTWGDEGILDFFGIPLLHGEEDLSDNNKLLISESIAKGLYGDPSEAIGKSLSINDSRTHTVTGVFQDIPENTSVKFETIGAIDVLQETIPWYYQNGENWGGYSFYTFFKFTQNADLRKVIESFHQQYYDRHEIDPGDLPEEYMGFDLINLGAIHLHSDIDYEIVPTFSLYKVRILELLALIISIIGWINFMNIQSAKVPDRLKEIGIRRSLGASLKSIRLLFLCEFLLINAFALGLAVMLAVYWLPALLDTLFSVQLVTMKLDTYSIASLFIGILCSSFYPAYVAANQLSTSSIVQSFRTDLFAKLRDVFVSIQ